MALNLNVAGWIRFNYRLTSPTRFDQWIEQHTRLPIRTKIIAFYAALQFCTEVCLGFVVGIVHLITTGVILPVMTQFYVTLIILFVLFSLQARNAPHGYWTNAMLVAVVTATVKLASAFVFGRFSYPEHAWPNFAGPFIGSFAILCIAGFVWRSTRKRNLAEIP